MYRLAVLLSLLVLAQVPETVLGYFPMFYGKIPETAKPQEALPIEIKAHDDGLQLRHKIEMTLRHFMERRCEFNPLGCDRRRKRAPFLRQLSTPPKGFSPKRTPLLNHQLSQLYRQLFY